MEANLRIITEKKTVNHVMMNQNEYWKNKWTNGAEGPENNFARRCFPQIKQGKNKTLLDLGCGNGIDSLFFASKGMVVTSIDFSESGINKLRHIIVKNRISNIKAMKKDIRKLDFDDNSFDVIYTHLSLHYFDDDTTTKIFNKLFNILRPGGMVFIKCKSTEDQLYGKGEKVGKDMFVKGHLRHFFSKDYMREKLSKFDIIKIRKTSSVCHKYKSCFIEAIATKSQ